MGFFALESQYISCCQHTSREIQVGAHLGGVRAGSASTEPLRSLCAESQKCPQGVFLTTGSFFSSVFCIRQLAYII